MSQEYYTKCCGMMFIGENHSPEMNGICRNCGLPWEGVFLSKSDMRRFREHHIKELNPNRCHLCGEMISICRCNRS
jgi:hypothetical protein